MRRDVMQRAPSSSSSGRLVGRSRVRASGNSIDVVRQGVNPYDISHSFCAAFSLSIDFSLLVDDYRREEILRNRKRPQSIEDAIAYFDSMATYVDELRKLQKELRHMIRY